ncbi:MAG: 5'/3'-nucleotidase SurE [Fimbriimonadaceae bacterium]
MRILVTNDDGIHAPGLRLLAELAADFGRVKVVAPDRERSACGHSMTMRDPLRVKAVQWGDIEAYEVNGVPVDCVNVGLTMAWPEGCDLILSGLNPGPNLGYDVTYSGTVAAAMEGAINGIRSLSISMAIFVNGAPPHFETGVAWIRDRWPQLMGVALPPETFLNINVPAIPGEQLRGERVVPMGGRIYEDRVEERDDPWGRPYFWQGGVAVLDKVQPHTDLEAVSEGFVAVTPLQLNWTNRDVLAGLAELLR